MKKIVIPGGVLLLTLIIFSVVLVSFKEKTLILDEVELTNYIDNASNMFAIMVEDDSGSYVEYLEDSFPTGMYFNSDMSNCINNNGETLTDAVTFSSGTATVYVGETMFCYLYFDIAKTLTNTILLAENDFETIDDAISYIESKGEPDFSETATTDEGLYAAEDDYDTSYYFRGAVEDNYVYFAGYYWRIIRINGDGSVRLIYDGTETHENGEQSSDRGTASKSYYNVETTNGSYTNAQVGYMFGTPGSSTYVDEHANTNDSTVKKSIDSWYSTNIYNISDGNGNVYSDYISDTLFCNDRSIYSGYGYGSNTTYYSAYNRLVSNKVPVLTCSQINDRFTVSDTTNGNGALTYPVALITADEVAMAGGVYGQRNTNFYLYGVQNNSTDSFTTMTPAYYSNGSYTFTSGVYDLYYYVFSVPQVYRPVINLSSSVVVTGGDGTIDSPYTVGLS